MNSTDEVLVRLVEAAVVLERAADAARELLNRTKDHDSPLKDLVTTALNEAIADLRVRRRNFKYGHDCDAAGCDCDSHK